MSSCGILGDLGADGGRGNAVHRDVASANKVGSSNFAGPEFGLLDGANARARTMMRAGAGVTEDW